VGFGQEFLVFGPHRSTHRDKVEKELEEVFRQGEFLIKETQALDEGREEQGLRIALSIHARIIKIHPFEDGNGRTSRAIADYVLVRLGLEPIPIEAVKQEYINALHDFFESQCREIGPLVDVYLRAFEASSTSQS
jgi:fido (protein-threonine AMPylation protein)